ncbi:MAG: hypothetical protein GY912_02770 [Candidatus Marinimicrobia bacterium]|nr:hypothetical protein [Candidatus Neomarinimicrobiota bacterium]
MVWRHQRLQLENPDARSVFECVREQHTLYVSMFLAESGCTPETLPKVSGGDEAI